MDPPSTEALEKIFDNVTFLPWRREGGRVRVPQEAAPLVLPDATLAGPSQNELLMQQALQEAARLLEWNQGIIDDLEESVEDLGDTVDSLEQEAAARDAAIVAADAARAKAAEEETAARQKAEEEAAALAQHSGDDSLAWLYTSFPFLGIGLGAGMKRILG